MTATSAGMLVAGGAAWVLTVVWAGRSDTGATPGTPGMAFGPFVAMWAATLAPSPGSRGSNEPYALLIETLDEGSVDNPIDPGH